MKNQFATLLISFFWIPLSLLALNFEISSSHDYFRGLPDGSWNGNYGCCLSGNAATDIYEHLNAQIGASFGLYNWDGRENLVFTNTKSIQLQSFITAGLFYLSEHLNAGLLYDHQFTKHFGVYDLDPHVDQLRFQGGYSQCGVDEVGLWGTVQLSSSRKEALGVPISFRAISQINLFWTHFFENSATTSVWIGTPYTNSLMFPHKRAGSLISGLSLHAPLTDRLFIDGHGVYMKSRSSGEEQTRNYAANLCISITYLFGERCSKYGTSYMPVANNSNFLMDTNLNQ